MRWRGVPMRHQGWERRFADAPFAGRASSQPNNSRAWGADNFLTFLTASSTALMRHTLPEKLAGGKSVLSASPSEQNSDLLEDHAGLRSDPAPPSPLTLFNALITVPRTWLDAATGGYLPPIWCFLGRQNIWFFVWVVAF
jgi:hypothetical protein